MAARRLGIGLGQALHVREERLSARPDACRLLYVSDVHLRNGRSERLCRQVLEAATRCAPHAVLLGGDLVDGPSELPALRRLVGQLADAAPVLAVGGNHDHGIGMDRVREAVVRGGGRIALCLALGRLLRSVRYARVRHVGHEVRKRRAFHAPLLIPLSVPLIRILDGGVRVLPRRAWQAREKEIYQRLYATAIRVEADGTLVLPCLPGEPLAALLEDPELEETARKRAVEEAAAALARFHHQGLTHGDAMAENVLVDLRSGVARWFDFETVHDADRPLAWRRSDDLRALLSTCLVRSRPEKLAETIQHVLDAYGDEAIPPVLAERFRSVWQRALSLHLLQAPLSFQRFREIARLLGV